MERRTEGNAELIEAAMVKLVEILEDNELDTEKMLAAVDSPLDADTIYMLIPSTDLIGSLLMAVEIVTSDGVTVMIPNADFFGMMGSLCVRSFLHGYISAKMEAGNL